MRQTQIEVRWSGAGVKVCGSDAVAVTISIDIINDFTVCCTYADSTAQEIRLYRDHLHQP